LDIIVIPIIKNIFTLQINPLATTVLLITPPFTQLNTPYPATAYIKGFLNTRNISAYQSDMGIEVILKIFSKNGLEKIFTVCPNEEDEKWNQISANARRIILLKEAYLQTIDKTILFLQGNQPTLAHQIANRNFLVRSKLCLLKVKISRLFS
jgi:hypothetical protein